MSGSLKSKKSEDNIKYEEVAYTSDGANVFAPRSSRFGARFQMGVFLLAGVVLMLLHHYFYVFLDGKSVDSHQFFGHIFSDQSISSIVGNALAYAARTVLSAGIGIVFIQVLWSNLRRKELSIKQIDAMVACRGAPFTISALPTWHYAFWLAVIAAMATLMSVISIVVPGALRIESFEFSFPSPCTVPTVSVATADIGANQLAAVANTTDGEVYEGAEARLMALATQVLMSGSPLRPLNPCGTACQYQIAFAAPVVVCNPVDTDFNYTAWLPPPEDGAVRVWTARSSTPFYGLWTTVAVRDLAANTQSAVNCTAANATYHALITHSESSTAVIEVWKTDFLNDITEIVSTADNATGEGLMQYDALLTAFADTLIGDVNFNSTLKEYGTDDNFFVAYSPSFVSTSGSIPWSPTPSVGNVLTTFMQNMAVSLLSDQILYANISATSHVDAICYFSSSSYSYNRVRLLATYGAALGVAAACMLVGAWAIHANGAEESVAFSRILGAILNKSLFDDRFELSKASKLTAIGSHDGQLRLVHTTYGPGAS